MRCGHTISAMSTVIQLHEPDGLRSRIGAEIRSRMARYGVSQVQLAAAMGLSQSQVSKRLRGAIAFNTDELEQVATALGTTVLSLLGAGNETAPRPDGPRDGGLRTRRDSNPQPSDLWSLTRITTLPVRGPDHKLAA